MQGVQVHPSIAQEICFQGFFTTTTFYPGPCWRSIQHSARLPNCRVMGSLISEAETGTPITPASRNVCSNFGLCFRVNSAHWKTGKREIDMHFPNDANFPKQTMKNKVRLHLPNLFRSSETLCRDIRNLWLEHSSQTSILVVCCSRLWVNCTTLTIDTTVYTVSPFLRTIAECFTRLSHGLGVCLSVTLLYCVKTTQARITKSSLWAASRTLVYRDKISCPWVREFPSNEGVK